MAVLKPVVTQGIHRVCIYYVVLTTFTTAYFIEGRVPERKSETERSLASAGLLLKGPEWPELGRSEAGSQGLLPSLSGECRAQALESSSIAFPGS